MMVSPAAPGDRRAGHSRSGPLPGHYGGPFEVIPGHSLSRRAARQGDHQRRLYGSQADSAGSIPVTRSSVRGLCSRNTRTGPPRISAWGPSPQTPRCGDCAERAGSASPSGVGETRRHRLRPLSTTFVPLDEVLQHPRSVGGVKVARKLVLAVGRRTDFVLGQAASEASGRNAMSRFPSGAAARLVGRGTVGVAPPDSRRG